MNYVAYPDATSKIYETLLDGKEDASIKNITDRVNLIAKAIDQQGQELFQQLRVANQLKAIELYAKIIDRDYFIDKYPIKEFLLKIIRNED